MLEENISVLVGTTHSRMLRIQCMCTELCNCIHVAHLFEICIIPLLDLLDLMGSTESVEEVDERNLTLDCSKMSYRA